MKPKHKKLSVIKQYDDDRVKQYCADYVYRKARAGQLDGVVNDITETHKIRVPRLKASRATWKKFYAMFPWIKGAKTLQKCFYIPWMNVRTDLDHTTVQHLKLKQFN